jgi:predicted CoA-binding protein
MMTEQDSIQTFLSGKRFAVVGASQNREKYGNKVLRAYLQNDMEAIPVHPSADEIEGRRAFANLSAVPTPFDGVSVITPPAVTERVVEEAIELGIKNIWLQPGAESQAAIDAAQAAGINVIANGPCVLVALGFREAAR